MDQNGFDTIFNLITLGYGLYAVYTWFQLRGGALFPNPLLIPKDLRPDHCLDEAAYVAYIRPRTLILGVIAALSGGAGMADQSAGFLAAWAAALGVSDLMLRLILMVVLPLAVVIWYAVCLVRAQRKYFP